MATPEFLKSVGFIGFANKKISCPTEITILSVQMSDTMIPDVLYRSDSD